MFYIQAYLRALRVKTQIIGCNYSQPLGYSQQFDATCWRPQQKLCFCILVASVRWNQQFHEKCESKPIQMITYKDHVNALFQSKSL